MLAHYLLPFLLFSILMTGGSLEKRETLFDSSRNFEYKGISYKDNGSYCSIKGYTDDIESKPFLCESILDKPVSEIKENTFIIVVF